MPKNIYGSCCMCDESNGSNVTPNPANFQGFSFGPNSPVEIVSSLTDPVIYNFINEGNFNSGMYDGNGIATVQQRGIYQINSSIQFVNNNNTNLNYIVSLTLYRNAQRLIEEEKTYYSNENDGVKLSNSVISQLEVGDQIRNVLEVGILDNPSQFIENNFGGNFSMFLLYPN